MGDGALVRRCTLPHQDTRITTQLLCTHSSNAGVRAPATPLRARNRAHLCQPACAPQRRLGANRGCLCPSGDACSLFAGLGTPALPAQPSKRLLGPRPPPGQSHCLAIHSPDCPPPHTTHTLGERTELLNLKVGEESTGNDRTGPRHSTKGRGGGQPTWAHAAPY